MYMIVAIYMTGSSFEYFDKLIYLHLSLYFNEFIYLLSYTIYSFIELCFADKMTVFN